MPEKLPAVMLLAFACGGVGVFCGIQIGKYSVLDDCNKLGAFVVREAVYSCKAVKP